MLPELMGRRCRYERCWVVCRRWQRREGVVERRDGMAWRDGDLERGILVDGCGVRSLSCAMELNGRSGHGRDGKRGSRFCLSRRPTLIKLDSRLNRARLVDCAVGCSGGFRAAGGPATPCTVRVTLVPDCVRRVAGRDGWILARARNTSQFSPIGGGWGAIVDRINRWIDMDGFTDIVEAKDKYYMDNGFLAAA